VRIFGELVRTAKPRGRGTFDVFLVAQMRAHSIGSICTDDARDLSRLGVSAITPEESLATYPA
jgi:predicted nucleic acid-binding protein